LNINIIVDERDLSQFA